MSSFDPVSLVMPAFNLVMQSQQSRAANKAAAAQAEAQAGQIRESQAIEERRRREQLKKTQATQRAQFGGSGVDSTGGSASALLQGLAADTDQDIADMRRTGQTKLNEIYQDLANQRRKNLLELRSNFGSTLLGAGVDLLK